MFGNEHNMSLQCINAAHRQQCCSQRAESMVLVLVLLLMPMVWAQPYPIPPTCYTKVLNMGKEITQRAAAIKKDHDTVSLTHPVEVSNSKAVTEQKLMFVSCVAVYMRSSPARPVHRCSCKY